MTMKNNGPGGCCCEEPPMGSCLCDVWPIDEMQVVIADYLLCPALNGTYVLDWAGSCTWEYNFPSPICSPEVHTLHLRLTRIGFPPLTFWELFAWDDPPQVGAPSWATIRNESAPWDCTSEKTLSDELGGNSTATIDNIVP